MKNYKFFVVTIMLLIFLTSCGDIVDELVVKVCEVGIEEIRDDYNGQISQIQNDPDLSQEEKDNQIEFLTTERDEEIQLFQSECSL